MLVETTFLRGGDQVAALLSLTATKLPDGLKYQVILNAAYTTGILFW